MKRKIFSVLFALVLVLSLGLVTAVPVAAEGGSPGAPVFQTLDPGTADWSLDYAKSGNYSVKLYAPAGGGYGMVIMPFDMAFAADLDFSVYLNGGDTAQDLPMLGIRLDPASVSDGIDLPGEGIDVPSSVTLIQIVSQPLWSTDPVDGTTFKDLQTDNNVDTWELYGTTGTGALPANGAVWNVWWITSGDPPEFEYSYAGAEGTFLTWAEIQTAFGGVATIQDFRVENSYPEAGSTVYVDDILINGVTYDLEPRVINTDTAEGFNTIQAAIDDANTDAGDNITVTAGTYDEYVNIDISLTLSGQPGAIVKPSTSVDSPIIGINADDVTVEGFEVDGTGLTEVWAGIGSSTGCTNVTIKDNTVHDIANVVDSGLGIGLWRYGEIFEDILIEGNTVYNTDRMGIYIGATPDYVQWFLSDNITIKDNIVHDTMLNPNEGETFPIGCGGIAVDAAKGSTIEGNTVYNTANSMPGIFLAHGSGHGNVISENEVYDQAYGIAVEIDRGGDDVVFGGDSPAAPEVHFNNIHDNDEYGLIVLNAAGKVVDATNNWWGNASGPIPNVAPPYTSYGDVVTPSAYVDYDPWLLEPVTEAVPEPPTFDNTLALKDGWTLVSTDKEVTTGTDWTATLAYKYIPGTGPGTGYVQLDMAAQLTSVDAFYLKTSGGGGVGINYSTTGAPGVVTKTLGAGWNIISCAGETRSGILLNQLREGQIGEQVGSGITNFISQGAYNQFTGSFSYPLSFNVSGLWDALVGVGLNAFDGYWVYMNAGKIFGVIPD